MSRVDEVSGTGGRSGGAVADFYGDPSEYPDCPMPDWLKRRLGLPPDERLIREAVMDMCMASMGSRTVPTVEQVCCGLEPRAGASAAFSALSRWLAPRSPFQMMAGWVQGLYTPRQVVARAIEYGFVIPGLRDQLRCVRLRGAAAFADGGCWSTAPGDPVVKLRGSARLLYLRERGLIDAWTAGAGLADGQVAVGGGCVLAARWGHRRPDGVDVVVQGRRAYDAMVDVRKKLTALAESCGGSVSWKYVEQAVRIEWLNGTPGTVGSLRFLGEVESPPEHAERLENLEGRLTRTLGNRQILWGKLDRCRDDLHPTDVFDIREAGFRAPEALAAAVNAWPQFTMRCLAQSLRSDAAAVGGAIEEAVWTAAGIVPGDGRLVAEEAGDAVERALYREVTVGVEKGLVRVDRVNGAGRLRPVRWLPDEMAVEAGRTGIAGWLDALGMSVVLADAAAVAGLTDGATEIWSARDGDTVRWRRPPEALRAAAAGVAGAG